MTSPTGSSPASPEGLTPPASGYQNVEVFGIKLPLPKWACYSVAVLAMLGMGISVFSQVLLPTIQEHTATSRAEKAKADADKAKADADKAKADAEKAISDAKKAKADADAAISRAKKDASDQQWNRFKEYQVHFGKTANNTQKFFDNPVQGSLYVYFYNSDGCLLVERKAPGLNQAIIRDWIPARSITLEAPPGTPDDVKESQFEAPPPNQPFLNAAYQVASFEHVAAPPARGREVAGCLDPHPGAFQSWNGQQNGCWIQIWRRWPEGCQHYQWFNSCNGYWDNHPNGAPRVYWTNCAH